MIMDIAKRSVSSACQQSTKTTTTTTNHQQQPSMSSRNLSGINTAGYSSSEFSFQNSSDSYITDLIGQSQSNSSPTHQYVKPPAPLPPPLMLQQQRQQKCLSNFLNDTFACSNTQSPQPQSPGPSSSLAASTSITGFSSTSGSCSASLMNGFNQDIPNLTEVAPSRSQWYHGRLDRKESEGRLIRCTLQSYLIRESDRKPGSYVLSFLGLTGINHFRVTAICGDYYFGGKQFSSLEELVGFYTICSDLLKNERLVNPVPPPEPIRNKDRRVVAILPYTKMHETDELSFRKGDIFIVHNEMSDRWLWCTNLRNQESGLVFADLVEQVDDDTDPNEVYGWFHSRITKEEAFEKLARSGPGSFLVRPSDNSPGDYSIFFHVDNSVQRFRIERHSDKYVMGGRIFPTLEAVIQRYKEEQIVEGHRLLKPVIKAPYETRWSASRAEELRSTADSIYATIRECREMAQSCQDGQKRGYLYKKSNKSKKWKNLYCVLNAKEAMLYFYDSPKRARPKSIVHLSYSALYMVHDSLFDRSNCFQLVERTLPCISTIYYLSASDQDQAQEWMQAIRPQCSPNLSTVNSRIFRAVHEDPHFGTAAFNGAAAVAAASTGIVDESVSPTRKVGSSFNSSPAASASGAKGVSRLRSLYITMIEAHRLPVKITPHPFVVISLNTVKVAQTSVKCPPDPIWEEDFVLEDIPADVTYFKLTLLNKGKRSKDSESAEINIELSRFQSGEEFEEWLHFSGLTLLTRDWGSVRVRVRFVNELIMPLAEYSPLKDLLLGDDLEVIAMCEKLCYHDRSTLAAALLKISRYQRRECHLIQALLEREIQLETDVSCLFRPNSLTTTLIDQYMKATCQDFLVKSLTDPINKVFDSKASCELNPAKLDSPSEACSNAENLLNILDEIVEVIFSNAHHCPPTVRYICASIKRAVSLKWPNDQLVRTRAVSAFIFLRLICPAILNPRHFGLISEMPSETALRTLILVAKSLQNLANLVEFGTKEPWMEVVNPFILKNKSRMIKYIDELASSSYCSSNNNNNNNGGIDQMEPDLIIKCQPDRELATIHSICETHLSQIQIQAHNNATLKKLATVIEMLTAHKHKYMDMI
ncbi:RAS p21 protein activator vap isoform X2 [Dermatophagoides pteronyssinus]|uniref:RAS p21 protein activator vap isoform X2 n=1 Tax=Dermatophagoides pteronyssinus TaxID=6956 RepID=UPI003F677680